MALKSIGDRPAVLPQSVLIVGTYGADGKPNAMNVAWGGQCGPKHIAINIGSHATTDAIAEKGAFTVALCDKKNLVPGDYVGIVSANKEPDKIAKTGWTAVKGEKVDAPVFQELPITMECKVVSNDPMTGENHIVGEIVNTQVDEKFLDLEDKIDAGGMDLLTFFGTDAGYYVVGERVGQAFHDGAALK